MKDTRRKRKKSELSDVRRLKHLPHFTSSRLSHKRSSSRAFHKASSSKYPHLCNVLPAHFITASQWKSSSEFQRPWSSSMAFLTEKRACELCDAVAAECMMQSELKRLEKLISANQTVCTRMTPNCILSFSIFLILPPNIPFPAFVPLSRALLGLTESNTQEQRIYCTK